MLQQQFVVFQIFSWVRLLHRCKILHYRTIKNAFLCAISESVSQIGDFLCIRSGDIIMYFWFEITIPLVPFEGVSIVCLQLCLWQTDVYVRVSLIWCKMQIVKMFVVWTVSVIFRWLCSRFEVNCWLSDNWAVFVSLHTVLSDFVYCMTLVAARPCLVFPCQMCLLIPLDGCRMSVLIWYSHRN